MFTLIGGFLSLPEKNIVADISMMRSDFIVVVFVYSKILIFCIDSVYEKINCCERYKGALCVVYG